MSVKFFISTIILYPVFPLAVPVDRRGRAPAPPGRPGPLLVLAAAAAGAGPPGPALGAAPAHTLTEEITSINIGSALIDPGETDLRIR